MTDAPNYFGIIPAPVRYAKGVEANAKLLFCEITALSNKHGYCFASNAYFAEIYDTTDRTVSRWVSSLEKAGFVKVTIVKEHGNERRIYPIFDAQTTKKKGGIDKNVYRGVTTKMSIPIDKNVHRVTTKMSIPIDKNVYHNSTSNSTFNNTSNNAVGVEKTTPPTPPILEKNKNEIEGGCTADLQHETKKTPNPPVPAPPPAPAPVRTAWQESEAYKAGPEKFAEMLRLQPGITPDIDCYYYYDRAATWSGGKDTQPLSSDWVGFIAKWVRGDIRKNAAVLISQVSTTGPANRPTYRTNSTGRPKSDHTPEAEKYKQTYTSF